MPDAGTGARITWDPYQYRRDADFDRWETLRRMTPEESIALKIRPDSTHTLRVRDDGSKRV